ncbi:MAG: endonuclease [Bacteroidetes bacterium]|nr:endonuclease [Bacteroidota bacterium]
MSCGGSRTTALVDVAAECTANDPAFSDRGDLRFVFYNVENLFDIFNDTTTIDEEFLPYGIKGWNRERYDDKLHKIFKVLVNTGGWELPEIIGLCEIENRLVLQDLLNRTPLARERYGIIHEDSPDARGIDLGFLFRKDKFIPIGHEAIQIDFPFDSITTRDILRIEGLVNKRDTLHIFLCHFPSRRGGQAVSEPKRMYVAGRVRAKVDSILQAQPGARIIITGDFNDEPTNKSIQEGLLSTGSWNDLAPAELHNYMHSFKVDDGLGTYKYQGYWNMLDQFMISAGLTLPKGEVYLKENSAQIFKRDWLMQEDPDAPGEKPFRTFGGAYYYGGYSDHLPIYLDIFFN